MCNKVDNDCRDEKLTCKGCAYCEKSADEMLEELGYEKARIGNGIEYYGADKEIDFLENAAGQMEKRIWIDDFHFITMEELKAINKKVEELRMEIVVRLIFSGIILFIGGFSIGAVIGLYLGERK